MGNLDYKGFKSTRLFCYIIGIILGSIFLSTGKLDGEQWITLTEWLSLFYAGSEVLAKGAQALKDIKTNVQN